MPNVVVFDHNDYHIQILNEFIKVGVLVLGYLMVLEKRVVTLERTGKMTLLGFKKLKGRGLAEVIHVFLIGEAVEAYAAIVRNAVLLHNLIYSVQDECRLAIVGLHRLIDDFCKLWIVAHKKPRVHADAVAANAGAWLKDVHTGVHIANLDDFVHVHVVVTAYS